MPSSRNSRLWNSFRFLALCVFIVVVIEPSEADPDWNCRDRACQKGTKCEKGNPCQNGGLCKSNDTDYICVCPMGYAGKNCDTGACSAFPCPRGLCFVSGKSSLRTCFCGLGVITQLLLQLLGNNRQRYRCSDDYDIVGKKCLGNPCLNGGSCYHLKDWAYCNCTSGWAGSDCSTKVESESSDSSSSSSDSIIGSNIVSSSSGSSDSNSSSTVFCTPNPCAHGSCTVSGSSFTCACDAGFQGQNCDQEDHCYSQPCVHGTCSNGDSTYTCTCQAGYVGTNCDIQDYCYSQPCVHGTCNNGDSTYTCTCQAGYVGTNCDIQDYCYPQPCVHGTCCNGNSTYTCTCQSGYVGTNCDKQCGCVSNPCQNGGTCIPDDNGGFTCNCVPPWYTELCAWMEGDFRRR